MTKTEALKMALDTLISYRTVIKKYGYAFKRGEVAITTIKEALAQPEQEPVATLECTYGYNQCRALEIAEKSLAHPKRELESTADMMMALADRLGELPYGVEPRAWEHLLVYAPRPDLTDADRKSYQAGHTAGVAHHKQAIKRKEWVGLTEKDSELVYEDASGQSLRPQDYRLVLRFAVAIEAKLKELNT